MTRAMTDESGFDYSGIPRNASWLPGKVELVQIGAGFRRGDDSGVQPGSGIRFRRSVCLEKSLEGRYHPQ